MHVLLALAFAAALMGMATPRRAGASVPPKPPDFTGVYEGDGMSLILADHPHWPQRAYVGLLIRLRDQRVQSVMATCDPIKGCRAVLYDGNLANQEAVELKLSGAILTLRYDDGPTLNLLRQTPPLWSTNAPREVPPRARLPAAR